MTLFAQVWTSEVQELSHRASICCASGSVIAVAQAIDRDALVVKVSTVVSEERVEGAPLLLRQAAPRRKATAISIFTPPLDAEESVRLRGTLIAVSSLGSASVMLHRLSSQDDPVAQSIHFTAGEIEYLAFDQTGMLLSVCGGQRVEVFTTTEIGPPLIGISTHTSVDQCAFHPQLPAILVSVCNDRTFRVSSLIDGSLVFQSAVLCSSPLCVVAAHSSMPLVALGATDSRLWVFDMKAPEATKELWSLDLRRSVQRLEPRPASCGEAAAGTPAEQSMCPLALLFVRSQGAFQRNRGVLVVATPSHLLSVVSLFVISISIL